MINKNTPCYRFADLPELLPRGDVLNLTEFSDAVGIAARAILGPGRRQRGEDNNDDFEAIHVGAWNCTKTEQWKSWADAFIWTVVRRRAKEGRSINRMGKAIDHPWNRLDKTSLKIGILRIAASQITKFLQVFLQLKICYFFKKWLNPASFSFIFVFSNKQQLNVKNVHPVSGAGIRIHNLLITCLLP